MRVVLDTNVIISRYLTPQGRVARIIDLWERHAFELVVSGAILREYGSVLRYPRHRRKHLLTDLQLEDIDEALRELTLLVEPSETPRVVESDPDDDHFLACADTGQADCIVSGDPHLLSVGSYKDIPILSPADFLRQYFPE